MPPKNPFFGFAFAFGADLVRWLVRETLAVGRVLARVRALALALLANLFAIIPPIREPAALARIISPRLNPPPELALASCVKPEVPASLYQLQPWQGLLALHC